MTSKELLRRILFRRSVLLGMTSPSVGSPARLAWPRSARCFRSVTAGRVPEPDVAAVFLAEVASRSKKSIISFSFCVRR